jgi:hypothetical protein
MIFCNYCGNYLSEKWKYCPYCGKKIKGNPDIFDSLFRDSISGISIHITSDGKKPRIRVNQFGGRKVPIEEPEEESTESKAIHPVPRSVLEPEGEVQQIGHHTLIKVKLPGVKKEDVDVRKLEESVEIKAYKGDKAYFKQFQVPESATILSKRMEGDELMVEVG